MSRRIGHTRMGLWIALSAALYVPVVWGAAGGSFPQSNSTYQSMSDEDRAKAAYNSALGLLKDADAFEASAANATGDEQTKVQKKARKAYERARKKFQDATTYTPQLAEAWNGVGYTQRKLGSYVAALAAYEQALKLKPGYPEALEYRGEAYLGLNRVAEAKQTYLDLFSANRNLSNTFLTAMRGWVQSRRQSPDGVDAATLSELEKWIEERSQIAGQTAAMTRAGAPASWK